MEVGSAGFRARDWVGVEVELGLAGLRIGNWVELGLAWLRPGDWVGVEVEAGSA